VPIHHRLGIYRFNVTVVTRVPAVAGFTVHARNFNVTVLSMQERRDFFAAFFEFEISLP
jgi:hypothetical protein